MNKTMPTSKSGAVDLVINGGTIVSPDSEYRASIAIKDGLIHAIGAPEAMPNAKETLDATGLHILPGAIDVHVKLTRRIVGVFRGYRQLAFDPLGHYIVDPKTASLALQEAEVAAKLTGSD